MNKKVRHLVAGVCGSTVGFMMCFASSVESAQAATGNAEYAIISGIRGDGGYGPGSIDVSSLSYWLQNQNSGSNGGKKPQGTVVGEINFMKKIDVTTPQIMADVASGRAVSGDFYLQKVMNGKDVRYFDLHFTGTISSDSLGVTSEGGTESVSINLLQATLSYTPVSSNGSPGSEQSSSWNLSQNASP